MYVCVCARLLACKLAPTRARAYLSMRNTYITVSAHRSSVCSRTLCACTLVTSVLATEARAPSILEKKDLLLFVPFSVRCFVDNIVSQFLLFHSACSVVPGGNLLFSPTSQVR